MPCRNEIEYVDRFLESVLAQRLPGNVRIEVLIADGASDDGTRERLRRYAGEYAFIRILDNPKRFVAAGLNAAIRQARGDVIVRMDVHTDYAPDYIFECLRSLEATGADNVGGPWIDPRRVGVRFRGHRAGVLVCCRFRRRQGASGVLGRSGRYRVSRLLAAPNIREIRPLR